MDGALMTQPTPALLRHVALAEPAAAERRMADAVRALAIDAAGLPWPVAKADGIVAINMIHIAPWDAATGLMAGAGATLPVGGILYLYGPFREDGAHTAPSNAAFDESLRMRNPTWGVRDIEAVSAAAVAV